MNKKKGNLSTIIITTLLTIIILFLIAIIIKQHNKPKVENFYIDSKYKVYSINNIPKINSDDNLLKISSFIAQFYPEDILKNSEQTQLIFWTDKLNEYLNNIEVNQYSRCYDKKEIEKKILELYDINNDELNIDNKGNEKNNFRRINNYYCLESTKIDKIHNTKYIDKVEENDIVKLKYTATITEKEQEIIITWKKENNIYRLVSKEIISI